MIKGFFLNNRQKMNLSDLNEVLMDLDVRKEYEPPVEFESPKYMLYKSSFIGDKYIIYLITVKTKGATIGDLDSGFLSTSVIYGIIVEAVPELVNYWTIERTLILATPKFERGDEDKTYRTILDEITRITGFLLQQGQLGRSEIVNFIRNYCNLIINYRNE